uniref:ATP synthase epsilon chain, chloroplastic n=1 Tax=Erodium absinthoides TaxID=337345 RepID=A0A0D3M002_9ROSI|nr:ATP synthase CF1 epsilon subunit [Erodium absinthoides]YP_009131190.1 ATP synthase CF1 epsilon subunit [Erodium absinthoides]AIA26367.1 ATP synthase CF1 epsilon subunit [Erodium absinthoides]AIA26402.1 ATP synthase CF1 epsilon subunit [Erodium absinthoides]
MTLNLCVMTSKRILWDSKVKVKEIILSTDSGQIGVLPNHVPTVTGLDMGVLKIRLNEQWFTIAVMGGFARIVNNEIMVFAHDAERGSDIDPQEAQQTLQIAEDHLKKAKAEGEETTEADQAVKRAKLRIKAIHAISVTSEYVQIEEPTA